VFKKQLTLDTESSAWNPAGFLAHS
jgi:hypothetical protein